MPYLKLPWLGRKCQLVSDKISVSISSSYNVVKLHTVSQTRPLLLSFTKDRLSYFHKNLVVYKFKYCCDAVYIGRTNLRLETQAVQHVPAVLRSGSLSQPIRRTTLAVHESTIGQHLLDNPACASEYEDMWFSVLHSARLIHHLRVSEAVFIKRQQPSLCRQKEHFLRSLQLLEGL